MFQFRLGGVPVQVHVSHLLISTLLAWSFAMSERNGAEWPGTILLDTENPQRTKTMAVVMLIWGLIISISVLVHELGHAFSARAFGYSPSVQLLGLGGRTMPNAPGEIPWHREVLLTLAGPFAGLLLGVVAGSALLGLEAVGPMHPVAAYVLKATFMANLFWALVNLVPVAPLDGGHIARAVLMHLFGKKGFLYAQVVTLLFAAAGLGLALFLKAAVLGLLFGLWGFRAVSVIQGYLRGELPASAVADPMMETLADLGRKLDAGQLVEARAAGEAVLRSIDVPAGVKARAHLMLGLVAVKSSDGLEALRHFRNVGDVPIPPHALAAAHSLVGDDETALPLWAEAARVSDDPNLRAEFAGTLLRLGRESDARALPGLRLAHGYLAAERVLYLRDHYARAAQMAEAAFEAEPSAAHAYTAACDWARAKESVHALRCLTLAAQHGYRDAAAARMDSDLASLRGTPEFDAWLATLPGPSK
ncbi:MAG: site-2 protease family protein [Myxococcales bacterium]|nr:site-2 protease family protein [Myxococcales bacterium]